MRAQHFLIAERERSIYDWVGPDSCRFDIWRFRAEPPYYKRRLHLSDTFAYHISADNNLFLTLPTSMY